MTTHDETHITRTSPGRFLKGLAIVFVTMGILGYITIVYWDYSASYPPPVSSPPPAPPVEETTGEAAGGSPAAPATTATGPTIDIPAGAATPGNPPYVPAELSVPKGETVTVVNSDNAPHTATSGNGPEDAGQAFDTSLIMVGASGTIDTTAMDAGEYPYFCTVHPFMKGTLTVTE
jgi:plastocyanin